jgi:preprotein translocase subunit SecD
MKKLLMAALSGVAFLMFVAAAEAGPVLQFRLATNAPSEGAEKMVQEYQRNGETVTQVLYVQREVLLDETMLKSASVGKDHFGHSQIDLTFNEAGKKKFAEVTRENLHKQLAVLIDGKIYTAPVIASEISAGKAVITGDYSEAEVKELAKRLNEAAGK